MRSALAIATACGLLGSMSCAALVGADFGDYDEFPTVGGGGAGTGGTGGTGGEGHVGGTTLGGGGSTGGAAPLCGNGELDEGESCDGDCVAPIDCWDTSLCTVDTVEGTANDCTAICTHTDAGCNATADGCCPSGCTNFDPDCQPQDVLLLGALGSAAVLNPTKTALDALGTFASVSILEVGAGSTPTLATLMSYEAIFVVTFTDAYDEVALGDVLADYFDAGGLVVIGAAAFCSLFTITGRFLQDGYYVIEPADSFEPVGIATMTDLVEPQHPLLNGVGAVDSAGYCFAQPRSDSRAVANFDSQHVAVVRGEVMDASGATRRRADLNYLPGPVTASEATLIANALMYR